MKRYYFPNHVIDDHELPFEISITSGGTPYTISRRINGGNQENVDHCYFKKSGVLAINKDGVVVHIRNRRGAISHEIIRNPFKTQS